MAKLPRPLGDVLDIGCGSGTVGAGLRAAGAAQLVGIELSPTAAARARTVFDMVLEGDAEQLVFELDPERFDTVCCYDILEHLYDPASLVEHVRTLVRPGAHLHVSIPNARYWTLFRDLTVRGTFGYATEGHRDVTHIRWFTRRDIVRLCTDCDWRVIDVTAAPLRPSRAALARLSAGWAAEFLALQWHVLCRA